MDHEIQETDVLIIGGGIAGVLAAIKAKEAGVDVILVDKGTVGKSGLSPFFCSYQVFDESTGVTRKQYIETVSKAGEYLANRDYFEMFAEDSKARYEELISWGAKAPSGGRGVNLRAQVEKRGVRMIERTMITDLLEKDGHVVGAVGFPMEKDKAIVIKAKAVVLCSGSGAYKSPGWPISSLTHDGTVMAYRVGADISGKEFADFHWTYWENPADAWSNIQSEWGYFVKFTFNPRTFMMPPPNQMPLQAHSGNVPLFLEPFVPPPHFKPSPGDEGFKPGGFRSPGLPIVQGATAGMAPHHCEGVFPKDNICASNIPGLFAAGDALSTWGANASGGPGGSSSAASAVQGGRAGGYAAAYARKNRSPQISNPEIEEVTKRMFEPRQREKGYSPAWVTQVLQGIMIPYYVLYIKKQDRLEAALANIKFLRDHFAPNLIANDTHELRLVHETRNMLLDAEMKLRASLFRTETRGAHYREDFPEKDDKNWLAWVIINKDGENMKLTKRPIPDEWKPGA
jgi:succinate dehydrogenase/fumarate reductase flavoprotein subunit